VRRLWRVAVGAAAFGQTQARRDAVYGPGGGVEAPCDEAQFHAAAHPPYCFIAFGAAQRQP
jgi:hypothetical protein